MVVVGGRVVVVVVVVGAVVVGGGRVVTVGAAAVVDGRTVTCVVVEEAAELEHPVATRTTVNARRRRLPRIGSSLVHRPGAHKLRPANPAGYLLLEGIIVEEAPRHDRVILRIGMGRHRCLVAPSEGVTLIDEDGQLAGDLADGLLGLGKLSAQLLGALGPVLGAQVDQDRGDVGLAGKGGVGGAGADLSHTTSTSASDVLAPSLPASQHAIVFAVRRALSAGHGLQQR